MNKLNYYILMLPLIMNFSIIFIISLPTKTNLHPISFLFILILLTLIISLKMNFMIKSTIAFMLFLMMIGGMMIIFMYITSLANNELFNLNKTMLLINIMKIVPISLLFIYLITKFLYLNINLNLNEMPQIYNFNINNLKNFNLLFKELNNNSTYYIMIYLYYTMICIMKICMKQKSPLRQTMF